MGEMDWSELRQKLRWYDFLIALLIVLGLFFLGWGFWSSWRGNQVEVEYLTAGEMEQGENLWVDVAGAVMKPGVYQLPFNARVKDALTAAGGLSETANREYVERVVNLADKLKDGEKIFIPSRSEGGGEGSVLGAGKVNPGGVLVNVNTASQSELDSLWGVGESRARAIIDNRPYKEVEELVEKKVIPKNVLERNKDKITVW